MSKLLGALFGRGPTFAERMRAAGGRSSGFDYLRIALSLLILTAHAAQMVHGPWGHFLYRGPGRVVTYILVPMFFGLGGFLVAASLDRTRSLLSFLVLRMLRIFPALWVDVLFAALVLGPLVTVVPLGDYFTASQFRQYLLNLVGDIHYYLPSVFATNPVASVNAQLWTVPWDLLSYLLLSVFALAGLYRRRVWFLIATILVQIAASPLSYVVARHFHQDTPDFRFDVVACFLTGVTLHLYRDRVRWNGPLLLLSVAAIVAVELARPSYIGAMAFPIVYLTACLGLLEPRRWWIVSSGDYSYGVFLYHWQIQQTLWLLVPWSHSSLALLMLSAAATMVAAFLSWHLIEKFALGQKYRVHAVDDRLAARLPFTVVSQPEPVGPPAGMLAVPAKKP